MTEIKAIETEYKGYRFRSRLEARWAVFFDVLGVAWKYETEGYVLEDGVRYLPDFWLPHTIEDLARRGWGMWAEIKPNEATDTELDKMVKLVSATKHNGLIFQGNPWPDEYTVTKVSGTHFVDPIISRNLRFDVHGACIQLSCGVCYDNSGQQVLSSYPAVFGKHDLLQYAYRSARGARFEYGEKP